MPLRFAANRGVAIGAALSLSGCFTDTDPMLTDGGNDASTSSAGTSGPSTSGGSSSGTTEAPSETTSGPGTSSTTAETANDVSTGTTGEPEVWEPSQLWIEFVDQGLAGDRGDALFSDDGMTVWMAGAVAAPGGQDMWVGQFDVADGTLLDVHVFDDDGGTSGSRGFARAESGDFIVAGNTSVLGTDRLVVSLAAESGTFTDFQIPPSADYDIAHSVAIRGADALVAGTVSVAPDDRQAWVGRFDGTVLDEEFIFGTPGVPDEAWAIVADPDGQDVVVVGAAGDPGGDRDGWVHRMTVGGMPRWTETYGGEKGTQQVARSVIRTTAGEYIVAGESEVPGSGLDVWLQAYGAVSGSPGANATWGGPRDQVPRGLALGPDDSIYVCGVATDETEGQNVWVAKFSPILEELGSFTLDGGISDDDLARACVVAGDALIVTGLIRRSAGDTDAFVAAYAL